MALAIFLVWAAAGRAHAAPGTIEIGATANLTVVDGVAGFTVPVHRVDGSAGAVGISYATVDGSALAGREYIAASGTLTWGDGDASDKTVRVTVALTQEFAGTRTFGLVLSGPTGGATLGNPALTLKVFLGEAVDPTIALSSPPADVAVTSGAALPLAASVIDPSGIVAKVQFFLNDQPCGETPVGGPYTASAIAPAAGLYALKAVALDAQGAARTASAQTLTVLAADPANPAPAAAILTDLEGRALAAGAKVTVSASGTGADGAPLRELRFYADGVLFDSFTPAASAGRGPVLRGLRGLDTAAPSGSVYSAKYTVPGIDKLVSIISVAIDKAGRAQVSAPVTVQAVASGANRAPKVKLSGIENGARLNVGDTFSVPAFVSDPDAADGSAAPDRGPQRRAFDVSGVISRVEYFLNSLKVKDSKSAPFGFDFSPPSAGAYVLSAIATDGSGLASVSKPITVEAVAPRTTVTISFSRGGRTAEGEGATLKFARRGGDLSSPLRVFYGITGTATNGADYQTTDGQPLSGTFTIPAGAARARSKLTIVSDGEAEGVERVKIKLQPSPTGEYEVGPGKAAKLVISGDQ